MKSKFIVNGYGVSGFGDVWFTGYIRYEFPDNTVTESGECEIHFDDYFACQKWVANMQDAVIFPEEMKGFRYYE